MGNLFSRTSKVTPEAPNIGKGSKQAKGDAENRLPAELRSFTPLSSLPELQAISVSLSKLEQRLIRDPASRQALADLSKGLAQASAIVGAAIATRKQTAGVVASCDLVISIGNDYFEGVYETVFGTIGKGEDISVYEEPAEQLKALSDSKKAQQRTGDIAELFHDALLAERGFGEVIEVIRQKLPRVSIHYTPSLPKKTMRIVEKVLLRPDKPGSADCICDVVRGMAVCPSMEMIRQVLQELVFMAETGTIVIVRIKDRLAQPASGGWRDCMVNFYVAADPNCHVVELQVAHETLMVARKGLPGHEVYGRVRNAGELLECLGLEPHRMEALKGRRAAGEDARSLLRLGCTPLQLAESGYTLAELKDAGCSTADLVGVVTPADVVISCDRADVSIMRRLRDSLHQSKKLSVWGDESATVGSKRMGPAISKCRVLVAIVSAAFVQSAECKDDIAFAFMSNKIIVPVVVGDADAIGEALPFGTTLMLSKLIEQEEWPQLDLAVAQTLSVEGQELGGASETALAKFANEVLSLVVRAAPEASAAIAGRGPVGMGAPEAVSANAPSHFWTRHFEVAEQVPWERFQAAMFEEFDAEPRFAKRMVKMADRREWLRALVHEHVFMGYDPTIANFEDFRGVSTDQEVGGPKFLDRVLDLAMTEVAIDELLDLQSNTGLHMTAKQRMEVILGLQIAEHVSIVASLVKLVKQSNDADVRSLALVAIGKKARALGKQAGSVAAQHRQVSLLEGGLDHTNTDKSDSIRSPVTPGRHSSPSRWSHKTTRAKRQMERILAARPLVEKCLSDPDRIVRQAAAATLGAIGHDNSVPLLVKLWRNDPIKDVRETAQDALKSFASSDSSTSQQMIDVTKILSDEVDALRREVAVASEQMREVTRYDL